MNQLLNAELVGISVPPQQSGDLRIARPLATHCQGHCIGPNTGGRTNSLTGLQPRAHEFQGPQMAGSAVVEPKKAHQGAHKSSVPSGAGE